MNGHAFRWLRRGAVALTLMATMFATLAQTSAQAAVTTHVSIAWNATTSHFHGKVSSANTECISHRTVRLYLKTGSGPMLEGTATSRTNGGWSIDVMNASGKYFAVVPKQTEMGVVCGRTVSKVVDVM
jgi:hypothetical protein